MANRYRLNIFPLAQKDLESIFSYIAEKLHNVSAAIKLIDAFENAFDNVCAYPESCPLVKNEYVKDKTLRKLIVNNYIAFFSVKEEKIQVVRVLYGMRNYQDIL